MRLTLPPNVTPVEPNPSYEETKANGEEALCRTFARQEVTEGIKSCLTPDKQKALQGYPERLQGRALATAAAYPPLAAPHAFKMRAAN